MTIPVFANGNAFMHRKNRFSVNLTEEEDLTPRSSPAASDESLKHHDIDQKPRKIVSDTPEPFPGYKVMRVAMCQTAAGLKPPSGGYRGNYASLFALSKHGHVTMQFCWAYKKDITHALAELREAGMLKSCGYTWGKVPMLNKQLEQVNVTWWKFTNAHGILCVALDADAMISTFPNDQQQLVAAHWIEHGEVQAQGVPYINWIKSHLVAFDPTHVIFNDTLASKITDDMPNLKGRAERVEVVHTAEQLPLGPFAGGISGACQTPAELGLFKELDGIIAVSKAIQQYAKSHCDLELEFIPNHPWSYKDKRTGDWPRYRSNFAKQNVVMINPAYVKGYEIYLAMARENKQRIVENNWDGLLNRPVYNFLAYSSWGSKPDMCHDLQAAGVKIFEPEADMEPVFDNMSVLIVPSLWMEAWGLVATEAQLRGIPVIASDVGGLPEAKRYVGPLIPVNKIDGRNRNPDGEYIIPPQDHKPWMAELDRLLKNQDVYVAHSHMAYYTTRQWLRKFDVRAMEKYLLTVKK